jgi:hypothetical protein
MNNPLAVSVNGVRWVPYEVQFQTQEGTFSFELFAVDPAHAQMRLEELRESARLTGWEIVGKVVP